MDTHFCLDFLSWLWSWQIETDGCKQDDACEDLRFMPCLKATAIEITMRTWKIDLQRRTVSIWGPFLCGMHAQIRIRHPAYHPWCMLSYSFICCIIWMRWSTLLLVGRAARQLQHQVLIKCCAASHLRCSSRARGNADPRREGPTSPNTRRRPRGHAWFESPPADEHQVIVIHSQRSRSQRLVAIHCELFTVRRNRQASGFCVAFRLIWRLFSYEIVVSWTTDTPSLLPRPSCWREVCLVVSQDSVNSEPQKSPELGW